MNDQGFTLIEIIIAVAIFAIIAVITSSVLVQTMHLEERVSLHSEQTTHLELAITLLQQDISQFVPRAVRGNEMHLFPPLIGQQHYLELTRGGVSNPMDTEQRSQLLRVAYLCEKSHLIRRVWQQLDSTDRQQYHDSVLLKELKSCDFEYMGLHNTLVSTWYQEPMQTNQPVRIFLPKAIQINLTFDHEGQLTLLFPLPGGLYA